MEYTFYPPHPSMARCKPKHMKNFTFTLPAEEHHDISQSMEPHRGQNCNLVVSRGCVPEYILLFVLRSMQFKMQFSLNVTSILDVVQHLRICQTQSFERIFVVVRYTDYLDSLEIASRIHWAPIWYFIIHTTHSVSLKLSKCKVIQSTVRPKSQLPG
jgi:hypothetical protein